MDRGAWQATVHELTESEETWGLNHHSKDTISQLSYIRRYWGVRISVYLFGGHISTSKTSHLLSLIYLQTMLYLMMTEMFSMPDHVPPLFKTSAENTFPMKKKKKKIKVLKEDKKIHLHLLKPPCVSPTPQLFLRTSSPCDNSIRAASGFLSVLVLLPRGLCTSCFLYIKFSLSLNSHSS